MALKSGIEPLKSLEAKFLQRHNVKQSICIRPIDNILNDRTAVWIFMKSITHNSVTPVKLLKIGGISPDSLLRSSRLWQVQENQYLVRIGKQLKEGKQRRNRVICFSTHRTSRCLTRPIVDGIGPVSWLSSKSLLKQSNEKHQTWQGYVLDGKIKRLQFTYGSESSQHWRASPEWNLKAGSCSNGWQK